MISILRTRAPLRGVRHRSFHERREDLAKILPDRLQALAQPDSRKAAGPWHLYDRTKSLYRGDTVP
jgi:hypothetical protein